MPIVFGSEGTRGCTFEDLLQTCCLGVERDKIDNVVDLLEFIEEEKCHLSELSWKGSIIAGASKTGSIGT